MSEAEMNRVRHSVLEPVVVELMFYPLLMEHEQSILEDGGRGVIVMKFDSLKDIERYVNGTDEPPNVSICVSTVAESTQLLNDIGISQDLGDGIFVVCIVAFPIDEHAVCYISVSRFDMNEIKH